MHMHLPLEQWVLQVLPSLCGSCSLHLNGEMILSNAGKKKLFKSVLPYYMYTVLYLKHSWLFRVQYFLQHHLKISHWWLHGLPNKMKKVNNRKRKKNTTSLNKVNTLIFPLTFEFLLHRSDCRLNCLSAKLVSNEQIHVRFVFDPLTLKNFSTSLTWLAQTPFRDEGTPSPC